MPPTRKRRRSPPAPKQRRRKLTSKVKIPKFNPPERGPTPAERLLVAYAPGERDPALADYIAIMADHGHEVLELEVSDPAPANAREEIRAHRSVRSGAVGGIVILGRGILPFPVEPRSDSGPMTDYSDLPFGSDFSGFEVGANPLVAADLSQTLAARNSSYEQTQWVSRIFTLNPSFLEDLRTTVPPQVNNMLIINADPNSDEATIQERWRQRYSMLTACQNARFSFRGPDFADEELLSFLEANLANVTFLSVTDHGNSTNLANLPGMRNGAPRLPALPDVVELAACATGRWTDDAALPSIKGLAESSLERGALAVIAPQCLLAWNFAKGSVGRPSHYDPLTDKFDQEIHNVAPWLDVWPRLGSLGQAQRFCVTESFAFLRESAYFDKGYVMHHVLCGHSLFGDGTIEFQSR